MRLGEQHFIDLSNKGLTVLRGHLGLVLDIPAIRDEVAHAETLIHPAVASDPGCKSIRTIYGMHMPGLPTHSQTVENIVKQLANNAASILAADVYCHRTWVNIKPPTVQAHGGEWLPHQDFYTWHNRDHIANPDQITFAVLLDNADYESGPLELLETSQRGIPNRKYWNIAPVKKWDGDNIRYSAHSATCPTQIEFLEASGANWFTFMGKPGDVLIYDNVIHKSKKNLTKDSRRMLFIAYNTVKNRPMQFDDNLPNWSCGRDFTFLNKRTWS